MPTTTITIPYFATGPTPPTKANSEGPNTLRTRVSELVEKMGPPPWSRSGNLRRRLRTASLS